jgi:hypothetical protein
MSILRWSVRPHFQPCADGAWVEYKKHLAEMKRVKDALRKLKDEAIFGPSILFEEIDALLAEED